MAGAQLAERAGLVEQVRVQLVPVAERAEWAGQAQGQPPVEPTEQVEQVRVVLARAEVEQMVA
jgi:hypothetical protein